MTDHAYQTTFDGLRVAIQHLQDAYDVAAADDDSYDSFLAVTERAYAELADGQRLDEDTELAFTTALERLADEADTAYEGAELSERNTGRQERQQERVVEGAAGSHQVDGVIEGSDEEEELAEADRRHGEAELAETAYQHDLSAITDAMRLVARVTEDEERREQMLSQADEYDPGTPAHDQD